MMRTVPLMAMVLTLPVAMAGYGGCPHEGEEPTLDTGDTPAGRYYAFNDACQPGCLLSVWIYAESNGEDGYQCGETIFS